ncbi:putative immunity protein [Streptomyces sp. NBC_00103]|uniref:putative immunity protein n=1 Tax=Streptomyces sp. NBC_00103 TaxID=2975653 RepID=UPI00225B31BD|nr:exonuclease SbcC [Streptomyces sp. NBC_00103]MCX5369869.1 exonuclease SbcC [Streptomyces sp. NBC_00103]
MPTESDKIELSEHELREIAGYAARCARRTLPLFEQSLPADPRPREAVEAAEAFAGGGRRTGALRRSAWAAYRAAQDAAAPASAASPASPAAADAARAASHAAAAAYLHPLANAHQVKHVLGAAAHAARAEELAAGDSAAGEARPAAVNDPAAGRSPAAGVGTLGWACHHAPPAVAAVLGRLPAAPPGGGRVGELMRDLDTALRA